MEIFIFICYIFMINVEEFFCVVIKDEFVDLVVIEYEEGGLVVVIVEVFFFGYCCVMVGYNGF